MKEYETPQFERVAWESASIVTASFDEVSRIGGSGSGDPVYDNDPNISGRL